MTLMKLNSSFFFFFFFCKPWDSLDEWTLFKSFIKKNSQTLAGSSFSNGISLLHYHELNEWHWTRLHLKALGNCISLHISLFIFFFFLTFYRLRHDRVIKKTPHETIGVLIMTYCVLKPRKAAMVIITVPWWSQDNYRNNNRTCVKCWLMCVFINIQLRLTKKRILHWSSSPYTN